MFSSDNSAQIIYSLAVLVLLVTALYSRRGFTTSMYFKYGLIWSVVILFIVFCYSVFHDLSALKDPSSFSIKEHLMAELKPATPIEKNGSLQITKSDNSHFYIDISIEGKPITFLVDTGATYNVLSINHLKEIGYNTDSLDYIFPAKTGNGTVKMAYASLKTSILGHNLGYMSFMITKDPDLDIAVVGMNFLDKFDGFKVENNKMTLELN